MKPVRIAVVMAVLAASTAGATTAAQARRAIVTVDGRSMPWDPGLNPKRSFGVRDGQRPVYVWGLPLVPGRDLSFTATGRISVLPSAPLPKGSRRLPSAASPDGVTIASGSGAMAGGSMSIADMPEFARAAHSVNNVVQPGASWGPSGQPFRPADRNYGGFGALFPSYHMPNKAYPVNINALIGAFIDADGAIVGEPFKIGEFTVVEIPKGAAAVSMGLNAETFAYNRGVLNVVINTRTPKVTVEPSVEP